MCNVAHIGLILEMFLTTINCIRRAEFIQRKWQAFKVIIKFTNYPFMEEFNHRPVVHFNGRPLPISGTQDIK